MIINDSECGVLAEMSRRSLSHQDGRLFPIALSVFRIYESVVTRWSPYWACPADRLTIACKVVLGQRRRPLLLLDSRNGMCRRDWN